MGGEGSRDVILINVSSCYLDGKKTLWNELKVLINERQHRLRCLPTEQQHILDGPKRDHEAIYIQ